MTHARVTALVPAALLALVSALAVALSTPMGTDFSADAQPAIDALARGDLPGFFAAQPQMGPLSVVLRAPLAALGGGDAAWSYRLGALACLLFPVALTVGLVALRDRQTERRGLGDGLPAVVLLLTAVLVANPVVVRALELGHPEEPMGAALCTAAVVLALHRRATLAGVALGLALATKQWALLAVVPVLLAAPAPQRRRVGALAVAIGGACALLPLAVDPHAFLTSLERPVAGLHELRPGNLWSLLLGPSAHVDTGGGALRAVTYVPGWLRATGHPAVAVGGVALALAWGLGAGRRAPRPADVLALLALVMIVRCLVDPWNHEYYHLPALTALAAWEVLALRRAPVAAGLSSALLWLVFARLTEGSGTAALTDALYVGWALAAIASLARVLWWPRPARVGVALAAG